MERDLRLYCYTGYGTLYKVGKYKTDKEKLQRHFFETARDARAQVELLLKEGRYRKGTQFLIIEYVTNPQGGGYSIIRELINT